MATIKTILYKGKTAKNGMHPVILQIIHNRKTSRISLGYKALPQQWDDKGCKFKRNVENYQIKNRVLRQHEIKAERIIDDIALSGKAFTPKLFKDEFKSDNKTKSVFDTLTEIIVDLQTQGKINTANTYVSLENKLKKFNKGKTALMFPDIDYRYLKKFETYLAANGNNGGGQNYYFRTLRSVFNKAITLGYTEEKYYPFTTQRNKNGFSINRLKSSARPRALSLSDMEKLKGFDTVKNPHLEQSFFYFLFSYYARGMNFHDMAYLSPKQIFNGRLNYTRKKTGGQFTIPVSDNLAEILDHFQKEESLYVFPVLSDFHKTEQQKKDRIKKCLKKYNKDLKEIGTILKLEIELTSYVARHTYATTLKRKDVSLAKISEAMGHSDVLTTKAYLEQFENSEIDALDNLL